MPSTSISEASATIRHCTSHNQLSQTRHRSSSKQLSWRDLKGSTDCGKESNAEEKTKSENPSRLWRTEARPSTISSSTRSRVIQHVGQASHGPVDILLAPTASNAKVSRADLANSVTESFQSRAVDGRDTDAQVAQQKQPTVDQPEGRKAQRSGFALGHVFRSFIPGGRFSVKDEAKEARQRDVDTAQIENTSSTTALEEIQRLRHTCSEFEREQVRLQDELSKVRREFEEYKTRRSGVIQEKETVGARSVLTKANSLTISDAINKLAVLNEEIFQAAASLANTVVRSKRNFTPEVMQRGRKQVRKLCSEPMIDLLSNQAKKSEPIVNPLVAQAFFSTFFVDFCVSKLGSWYPGDEALDRFLGKLYNEIRISEKQAVSGGWRALTRSRTRPATENWKVELIENLQNILVAFAWEIPTSHQVTFEQKLVPIFQAVESLRITLGEEFTSSDLEVSVVPAGSKFEDWKEDTRGDGLQSGGKRANHEVVAGTTGMGLKRILVVKGSRNLEEEIFLPPKVVLESTLQAALAASPTKKVVKDWRAYLDGKEDIYQSYGRDQ
ncbi:hypothetical protein GALMADRAFT_255645 [Galerina marginata CBS 339.88]|uniref:Uncharacterized protein n=1 Tax=Galerina marginata (strain CBS 339.88) TaxID=685588 RepID=A0A067SIJ4_GALM3|nr:hypothetical protein GALMADRAFT_255645 [Galerina marginata CBS 339.88]